jgi:MtrB/PioB family decaheme-associated outer membrane protein
MHGTRLGMWLAISLAFSHGAAAQTNPPGQQPPEQPAATAAQAPKPYVGQVDVGFRLNAIDGDDARLQRFQDLRDGPLLQALRYTRSTDLWEFNATADGVGYRDQRYAADWDRFGRMRASFEWTQIPWFHSVDTRTQYTREGEALRLPDAAQGSNLTSIAAGSPLFETRARRDIADARFSYSPTTATDVSFRYSSTRRSGEQPWGAGFGFTAANEVPLPLDQRTNDLNATLQWAAGGRLFQVGYAGSFYDNDVSEFVWDSPLTLTDAVNNPAQGRMAVFPSSVSHTVSAFGAWPLPGRSRAHAYVSVGTWSQDEPLVPHTINTAIPSPSLSRPSAEAEARIIATNLGFNTRPARHVTFSGRYRIYDFDNRTPPFAQPQYVRADQSVATSVLGTSEPFEYRRHFLDLNAVYRGLPHASVRVGYGMEHDNRRYRFLEQTTDHVLRASIDTVGLSWLMLRAQYEHSERTGEGFDEQALSEINEQLSLRQFDISDRTRDRLSTIVQLTPMEHVGLTATVGMGRDDRPDEFFGLLDNRHRFYTVVLDVTPSEMVGASLSYGREHYDTLQRSRQANPGAQFNDPTRDWDTDMDESADTFTAAVDLPKVTEKTTLRIAYDFNRARSRYLYVLPANTTLATPEQLPPVRNAFHRARTDVRHDLTARLGLGLSYWFDKYDLDDFAKEPEAISPFGIPGSGLFLGYVLRPYTAHTASLRLIVNW